MATAETKTTTTTAKAAATPTSETPFFKGPETQDTFFSPAPAIQKAPAAAATPPATPATPPAAPTPTATPQTHTLSFKEIGDIYMVEARQDVRLIKNVFAGNWHLGDEDENSIMIICRKWANKSILPDAGNTPFDYFIQALQGLIWDDGYITTQYTNPFDEIYHRMSRGNINQFQVWMITLTKMGRGDKPHEKVALVTKEGLMAGLDMAKDVVEAGIEIAAAGFTGGGSEVALIAKWAAVTLPNLIKDAKAVFDIVKAIQNLDPDEMKQLFTARGVGDIMVRSIFGDMQGLPVIGGAAKEGDDKDQTDAGDQKGFMKLLITIRRVILKLISSYRTLATHVNKVLHSLDITHQPWFDSFSMAYTSAVGVAEAIAHPDGSIEYAASALHDATGVFFEGIKSKLSGIVDGIKDHLKIISEPARLFSTLSEKIVDWVLNFVITNPPSALFKLLAKLVQKFSGKSIIELLKEKFAFANDIIKKIADSQKVQELLQPLKAPVSSISGVIDSMAGKTGMFINSMEDRVLSFVSNGGELLKQMAGGQGAANPAGAAAAGGGDVISYIKSDIHHRLVERGKRLLAEKGQALGKAAVAKGKKAILSWWEQKKPFTSTDNHQHTLLFEGTGKKAVLTVRTTPMPVEKFLAGIAGRPEVKDEKSPIHAAFVKSKELVNKITRFMDKVLHPGPEGRDYNEADLMETYFNELANELKLLIPLDSEAPVNLNPNEIKPEDIFSIDGGDFKVLKIDAFQSEMRGKTEAPKAVYLTRFPAYKKTTTPNKIILFDQFLKQLKDGTIIRGSNKDKRKQYMGSLTDKEREVIWPQVVKRMTVQHTYNPITKEFFNARPPKVGWFPEAEADLGHTVGAVQWWNVNRVRVEPRNDEVRKFMLDANNYELEEPEQNRERGRMQKINYQPHLVRKTTTTEE